MQRASSQQATASTTAVSKPKGPRESFKTEVYGTTVGPVTAGTTAGTCTHKAGRQSSRISGHMSQHISKAPALGKVRLREIEALVNETPRGQGRRGACKALWVVLADVEQSCA